MVELSIEYIYLLWKLLTWYIWMLPQAFLATIRRLLQNNPKRLSALNSQEIYYIIKASFRENFRFFCLEKLIEKLKNAYKFQSYGNFS